MHLSERDLQKLKVKDVVDLSHRVTTAILKPDDYRGGAHIQTHNLRDRPWGHVDHLRDAWEASGETPTNLLADIELRPLVHEWITNQEFDVEFARALLEEKHDITDEDREWLEAFAHKDGEAVTEIVDALHDGEYDVDDTVDMCWHLELLRDADFFADLELDDLRDRVDSEFREGLSYWTRYWQANGSVDVEAAARCSLMAFEYEGDEYLGLGGCGMDLSPRLDAYQALTCGSLPEDSRFFDEHRYFEHVVGTELMAEVDAKARLTRPLLVLTIPWGA